MVSRTGSGRCDGPLPVVHWAHAPRCSPLRLHRRPPRRLHDRARAGDRRSPRSRDVDRVVVRLDGTGLEPVTTPEEFDGFPMLSRDGRTLVRASSRGASRSGDTSILVADWIE